MNGMLYAPILKWKTGEKLALKNLNEEQKSKIIPIVEITDYEEPTQLLSDLKDYFDTSVYIDTSYVDEGDRDYLLTLAKAFETESQPFNPILYFEDFPEIADEMVTTSERILVRISLPEDFDGPSYSDIFSFITDWANNNETKIDVLLNLDYLKDKAAASSQLRDLKHVLTTFFLNHNFFDRIIISATSFPTDLSFLPPGGVEQIERLDIRLFLKIFQNSEFNELKANLIFSDYGVTRFTETELDFSKMRYGILPKARYTTNDFYWILKGKKDRRTNTWIKSYAEIAKEIEQSKYYFGEHFSFGDLEIKERAYGLNKKGPGNNTNWVTIGANHHIAVVIEQLSKMFGI